MSRKSGNHQFTAACTLLHLYTQFENKENLSHCLCSHFVNSGCTHLQLCLHSICKQWKYPCNQCRWKQISSFVNRHHTNWSDWLIRLHDGVHVYQLDLWTFLEIICCLLKSEIIKFRFIFYVKQRDTINSGDGLPTVHLIGWMNDDRKMRYKWIDPALTLLPPPNDRDIRRRDSPFSVRPSRQPWDVDRQFLERHEH